MKTVTQTHINTSNLQWPYISLICLVGPLGSALPGGAGLIDDHDRLLGLCLIGLFTTSGAL